MVVTLGKPEPRLKVHHEPSFIGSKAKTYNGNRGNPKTQGAQKQRPPTKKETTPKQKRLENKDLQRKKRQPWNAKGSKTKTSDEKRGNPKTQAA
jgi:predicted Zn-dependent peptidase